MLASQGMRRKTATVNIITSARGDFYPYLVVGKEDSFGTASNKGTKLDSLRNTSVEWAVGESGGKWKDRCAYA